jgi:hypothetical protein
MHRNIASDLFHNPITATTRFVFTRSLTGTQPSRSSRTACRRHGDYATAGRSTVRIPLEATNISLLHNVQTGSGAHTTSHSMGTGFISREQTGGSVTLTTGLHLVPRLRMSGGVFQRPHMLPWSRQRKLQFYCSMYELPKTNLQFHSNTAYKTTVNKHRTTIPCLSLIS